MLVLHQPSSSVMRSSNSRSTTGTNLQDFVELGVIDTIPNATIAYLRERLPKASFIDWLFHRFEEHLSSQGLEARGGQIIDATLVHVPRKCNSRPDNESINRGEVPEEWAGKP
jgi:IS5 family transposase